MLHVHVGDLANADSFVCQLREHAVRTDVMAEDSHQYSYTAAIRAL